MEADRWIWFFADTTEFCDRQRWIGHISCFFSFYLSPPPRFFLGMEGSEVSWIVDFAILRSMGGSRIFRYH